MTLIRQYNEKDREQIIELWKTCNLTRPWNDPNKDFDRKNNAKYEQYYNQYLEIMRKGLVNLFNKNKQGSINYIKSEILTWFGKKPAH